MWYVTTTSFQLADCWRVPLSAPQPFSHPPVVSRERLRVHITLGGFRNGCYKERLPKDDASRGRGRLGLRLQPCARLCTDAGAQDRAHYRDALDLPVLLCELRRHNSYFGR